MSHSWTYADDVYENIKLTAKDVAAPGEPPVPVIKTDLDEAEYQETCENGTLLDACAAEILRMDQRIKALEGAAATVNALEAELDARALIRQQDEARIAELEAENATLREVARSQSKVVSDSLSPGGKVGVNFNALAGVAHRLQWSSEGNFAWMRPVSSHNAPEAP